MTDLDNQCYNECRVYLCHCFDCDAINSMWGWGWVGGEDTSRTNAHVHVLNVIMCLYYNIY